MTVLNFRILTSVLLLTGSMATMAATMDITASFSPSMDNPENNTFKNTTPLSGYCKHWPLKCPSGIFGIELPLTTTIQYGIKKDDSVRNNPYFGLPSGYRTVNVKNTATGENATVKWRVNAFNATYSPQYGQYGWVGGSFMYPNPPCLSGAPGFGSQSYYSFLWEVNKTSDVQCAKISTIARTKPTRFDDMSVGYELVTPDPLKLNSGIYTGLLSLSVGPGGDIDFGDNYQASDSVVNINFTLSVNHELKLTTTPENQKITLQPCSADKVCTEDDGKANWERWMITRVTPQLTGRSNFNISSSGSFHVYLQCEQQSGSDCALKSDNSSNLVPIQTLLTLPENIGYDISGGRVIRDKLSIGKDMSRTLYRTKSFGQNKKGSIDFLVNQRDVDTMLQSRPDTYRGAVTVIFDPNLY